MDLRVAGLVLLTAIAAAVFMVWFRDRGGWR